MHMACVMDDFLLANPFSDALAESIIAEIFAPNGAVGNATFGKTAVEIEHPHQAGPLTAPISHGENRTAMGAQAG